MNIKNAAILVALSIALQSSGQQRVKTNQRKTSYSKLTTDISVGFPLLQFKSNHKDWLIGCQSQYNVTRKINIVSYTGLLLYAATFRDNKDYIKTNHNYSIIQRFGMGTTFFTRGITNSFFLMAGFRYSSAKSTMNHPDFPEQVVTYSSLVPEYGVLYNLKVGNKKYFFSTRLYVPLHNLPLELIENGTIEFGVGMRVLR